jgi:AcrR family transcriptional regulator
MDFQRARNEEQRELRRQVILDTATAMLEAMPVSEISLNELSRRAGLAKSAMLRYFESREAVLLELLDDAVCQWVTEVVAQLPAGGQQEPAVKRGDRLAAVLSRSFEQRPLLCSLLSVHPSVLERNVSVEVLLRFKRSARANLITLSKAIRDFIPELGEGSWSVCLTAPVTAGALWPYAHPSATALAAQQADPALADLTPDFAAMMETVLARTVLGALAPRPSST